MVGQESIEMRYASAAKHWETKSWALAATVLAAIAVNEARAASMQARVGAGDVDIERNNTWCILSQ